MTTVVEGARERGAARREARRQGVLDVADSMFSRRGYHEVSLDEVAGRAGISKPGLYAYFGSKDGLYAAALRRANERLAHHLETSVSEVELPAQRLWRGICALLDYVEDNRDAWRMLGRASLEGGERFLEEAGRGHDHMADMVSDLFRAHALSAGVGGSALAAIEPLGHAFVGSCESMVRWWNEHSEVPKGTVAILLMNLAWMGLGDLIDGRLWLPEGGS